MPLPQMPSVTRRQAAALLVLMPLGVAACSDRPSAAQQAAQALESGVARQTVTTRHTEAVLISAYDAAIAAFPALAAALDPIRAQHAAHAAALGDEQSSNPPDLSTVSSAASKSAALRGLMDLEREASRERSAQAEGAGADRASLLTFIAASEGSHVPALKQVTA